MRSARRRQSPGLIAGAEETDAEDLITLGVHLGDETVVRTFGRAGDAPACDIVVAHLSERATCLGEIGRIAVGQDIAASLYLARGGIDSKTEQTRHGRVMAVAVVEEGQRTVVEQCGIMLTAEVLGIIEAGTVDTPEDVASVVGPVDLHHRTEMAQGAQQRIVCQHLHGVEMDIVALEAEEGVHPRLEVLMSSWLSLLPLNKDLGQPPLQIACTRSSNDNVDST